MPRLIAALIRHGDYQQLPDTPSAHQPFPLTEKGREQAVQAGAQIQRQAESEGWNIHSNVHSSQLLRAWETARLIAGELDGDFRISSFDDLAERSMGSAANLTVQQIEAVIQRDPRFDSLPRDWKSNSHFCLPLQGAESLLQAGQRVASHLEQSMQELAREAQEDTLMLFVGHGAAIRHAAYVLDVLRFDEIATLSMYHAEPVYIEFDKQGWKHVAGNWKVRDRAQELD
ncbi:MAG: histidine phosphatase family protein [Gammaproteobacteria bacterium]|nr:histidine phosphatase family protein [Gammaproteobacteria bacterium]